VRSEIEDWLEPEDKTHGVKRSELNTLPCLRAASKEHSPVIPVAPKIAIFFIIKPG
jgi:hypothetical protein